jgi:hypothetical protein
VSISPGAVPRFLIKFDQSFSSPRDAGGALDAGIVSGNTEFSVTLKCANDEEIQCGLSIEFEPRGDLRAINPTMSRIPSKPAMEGLNDIAVWMLKAPTLRHESNSLTPSYYEAHRERRRAAERSKPRV